MRGRLGALVLLAVAVASLVAYEVAPDTLVPGALRVACAGGWLVLAWSRAAGRTDREARATLIALALAGTADALLVSSAGWPRAFLLAMGLFLAGHVALVVAFGRAAVTPLRAVLTLAPLAVYAGIVLFVLAPFLGALRVPVIAYVVALTAMAWRACLVAQTRPRADRLALVAGGLLFVFADTLLAFDKFHHPIPHEKVLAMIPYWGSLACFAVRLGFVTPRESVPAGASTDLPPVAD